jgi:protocatechuate 3,4-dioxygenase beta subunit
MADGSYRFESRYPSNSAGVRPHIHFRVSAPGFETLHRTYFVQAGKRNVVVEVRLDPAR